MRSAISQLKLICLGEEDIAKGRSKPQDEIFAGIDEYLRRQNVEDILYKKLMKY